MEAASSDIAVSSDATDSPSRTNADPHSKTKRPDKAIYVPRRKREEASESESSQKPHSTTNGSVKEEVSSQIQNQSKSSQRSKNTSRGGNRKQIPATSQGQKSSSQSRRQPRENGEPNSTQLSNRGNRREKTGDRQSSAKQKAPATQSTNSSNSRIFHNSSGQPSSSSGNRRQNESHSSSKTASGHSQQSSRSGNRQKSNWNDSNYVEDENVEYSGSNNYRSSNMRQNSQNTQRKPGGREQRSSGSRQREGAIRGSTDMSIRQQTKAAEAIVNQLPDLLTGSSSRPHTAGSTAYRNKTSDSRRNDSRNEQYQSFENNKRQRGNRGNNRAIEYEDDNNHHDNSGSGHRGGLLFISQAGGAQDMHVYQQQKSPLGRNQHSSLSEDQPLSNHHSAAHLSEIDFTEQDIMVNFQTSGLSLVYVQEQLSRLRHLHSTLILGDAIYAFENNRDQAMWNGVFYKLYQILRYNLVELQQPRFAPAIIALVDDTAAFYDDICERLSDKYHVNVEISLAEVKRHGEKRSSKFARLLLQRLYISLGDLFRYRCSCSGQTTNGDVDTAQKHYENAQRLAPKNSHPFNQMAVLALMTRRRLDAVYYFCRALAASNPILSVSENLMGIFNEACRRSDSAQAMDAEAERNRRQSLSIDSRRSEVWVSHEGHRTVMSGTASTEFEDTRYAAVVERMPLGELSRRLVDSILNVHGRIFSKVGLDALPDAVNRCLWELEAAMAVDLPMLTPTRLAFLTLLNFFSVWKCSADSASGNKSIAEIYAVEFVLDCAALIIRHARILFAEQKFDGLRRLMPCVKLYVDWLIYNRKLWNPPPCALDPTSCPDDLDLFAQIAGFANITAFCDVSAASEAERDYLSNGGGQDAVVPVHLEEDDVVQGFSPFGKIRIVSYETMPGTDPSSACFAARLQRFRFLLDYLVGMDSPALDFNVESNFYTPLLSSVCRSEKKSAPENSSNMVPGDFPPPLYDSNQQQQQQDLPHSGADSNFDAMRRRRRDLVAEAEKKRADEEYLREVMAREQQVAAGNVVMEVHPVVLVIDTNSIVDFLPAIQRIVESNKFTVVIPVVVFSELSSLSMGNRQAKSVGGFVAIDEDRSEDHVPATAHLALKFFDMQLSRRNPRVKAMTSEGNFVFMTAFRDQMRTAQSNDDMILECALHYCKMNEGLDRQAAAMATAGGSGALIKREVVLITCDRNLRIKAHLKKVPTCPLRTLLGWAGIPVTGTASNVSVHA